MFDDFDTQVQSDEFWDIYDVDCDDGTHDDKIYVPHVENAPIVQRPRIMDSQSIDKGSNPFGCTKQFTQTHQAGVKPGICSKPTVRMKLTFPRDMWE